VQRPPYSVGVFTLAEIKCINDYVLNGFFRHYKLYRYVFTKEQRLTVGTREYGHRLHLCRGRQICWVGLVFWRCGWQPSR
jgi:hypothetical protein